MKRNSYPDELRVAANQNIKAKNFWLKQLSGDPVKSHFPYDHDGHGKNSTVNTLTFQFTGELFSKLKKISANSDIKLHMILTAALIVLVQKYTGNNDIIIGTSIYKQEIQGEFINTVLSLRTQIHRDMTFKEFLPQFKQTIMEALENYNYPIEIMVEQLNLQTSEEDFPLFDMAVLLENIQDKNHINHIPLKIIFSFLRIEAETCIKGMVNYNSSFYRETTIERIIKHFNRLISHVLFHADVPFKEVDILSTDEKKQLLIDFNRTCVEDDYPAHSVQKENKTIIQLFEQQVQKTPGKKAIVFNKETLTYKQLNERVNRTAWFLRKKGVTPDTIVGIMLEHSLDMLIAVLAVWKAGGAYLPIGADYPQKRIISILNDSQASIFLTEEKILKKFCFTPLQSCQSTVPGLFITPSRSQVENIDALQIPDRSLVDYEKYRPYIGQAAAKNSITVQFSRGCVYNCAFCFKVWPHQYIVRSAENLFQEIQTYYNMGIRRFAFVDDLPNLNIKNSSRFYELIIKHGIKVHLHFPNGIRGDILTKDHIDLMVKAGTVNMDLALETTSPRLQKLIRKGLNLEKLDENIHHIIKKHPQVILELQIIHGIPTETETEAMASLDYIKNLKWVHFPYIHILNIYPNSAMAKIAMQHGISKEAIQRSADIAYHELPETLPFPKPFTKKYQSEFVSQYFMSKERLLAVLPHQMQVLTEDELVQKYNSYLPVDIHTFSDLLNYAGISRQEINSEFLPRDFGVVTDFNEKLKKHFAKKEPGKGALRLLLLDLSQYFSHETRIIYDVVEPPLGLMYLLTHLNREFPGQIHGKIAKSRIDFDNYDELKSIIREFKPQVIGIRSLNFYKEFFHQTISIIRQWGIPVPIIAGGPYATSNYATMMQDHHIDLAVLGEGEITFAQLIGKILENNHQLPPQETLKNISGLTFIQQKEKSLTEKNNREIVIMDQLSGTLSQESPQNPGNVNNPADLAYIIYTSGSTGTPKGVMIRHDNLFHQITGLQKRFKFDAHLNYLLLAAFTFDVSVMHICLPLTSGAKLFLIDELTRKDPLKLWQFIHDNKIDILNIVPAFMKALLENLEKQKFQFKYLFVGGDLFKAELYRALKKTFKAEKIINIYGPTETTINATLYECQEENTPDIIPIGKPLPYYRVYILDRQLSLLPPGAAGELCISGYSLARGYLNRPELTAEKFIPNPCTLYRSNKSYMSYIYRTGDLVRWAPDKNIQFLGRIDQQVKIRGFRIELGEIEKKLKNHKNIKNAVVIAQQDKEGDKYLSAYIVPQQNVQDESSLVPEVKEYLSRELPDYMVPPYFVKLGKIPLNINGKVDKKMLPTPERTNRSVYTPPRNQLEKTLVELWSKIIGIEKIGIGIDTNFFELGGHSLKATILISKIHKELDVKVPLVELFKNPFIRGLASYINEARQEKQEKYTAIRSAEKQEFHSLSSAQQRLFILQQMEPAVTGYNMPSLMILQGILHRQKLQQIFKKLVQRHESFRTSFEIINDVPVQKIHETVEFEIKYYDLYRTRIEAEAHVEEKNGSKEPEEKLTRTFIRPFNLSTAPLLRVELIKTHQDRHILMIDMHHIVTDGISNTLFIKDLLVLYQDRETPALKLHYKDYAQWQHNEKENQTIKKQKKYWLQEFKGEIPLLNLPVDYPRPDIQSFAGAHLAFKLNQSETARLNQLALAQETTLFMFLLALFNILMSKLSGQEEIVVGTPIAGRRHPDLENIIGMFVNTLALKNFSHRQKSFKEFLKNLKKKTLAAFENQEYQFEDLVEQVVENRDPGRNPLFDVMFALNNIAVEGGNIPDEKISGLAIKPYNQENNTSKFDLSLFGYERENQLFFTVEYCTSLFKPGTINRFVDCFKNIVHSLVKTPGQKLSEIEIISAEEKNLVLQEFNNTRSDYPRDSTIRQLFSVQAAAAPDSIALVHNHRHLSYRHLNEKAKRLAGVLKEKGVKKNNIAGIMTVHSVEMAIGVVGVTLAGAAYLPVNPDYPLKRKKYMLADSQALILLSNQTDDIDYGPGIEVIQLNNPNIYRGNEYLAGEACFDDLAYVLYTSGSTGKPKGVMVEQRSVIRLVKNTNYIRFHEGNRLLQTSDLGFDVSTFEIWGVLLNGSQLFLVDKEIIMDTGQFKGFIHKYHIQIMWMTTPLFNHVLQMDIEIFAGLKQLLVGGEALSPTHINQARRRFPPLEIINGYGPTENTSFSTTYLINKEHKKNIPIGKPIANSTAYIVDQANNLLPIGIPGELIVGGDGVARGYLNNPELTAKKFQITNKPEYHRSYKSYRTYILYRTGDLARWLPDGNIQFLGRLDFQVKIRGFRIELGEIESQLINHPHIKEAVVITLEDSTAGKQLGAYLVCENQSPPTGTALKTFLAKSLPHYMIPTFFVTLDRIPLTPNGKIDKRALPIPEITSNRGYTAPGNKTEEKLVEIWSGILLLKRQSIGINDSFFELGGHSLNATIMAARIHKEFQVKIPLAQIFKTPTIKGISQFIGKTGRSHFISIVPGEKKEYYPLSSSQKQFYVLQQVNPHSIYYNMPTVQKVEGLVEKKKLENAFHRLIQRHDTLRTSFIIVNQDARQRVHDRVKFHVQYYDIPEVKVDDYEGTRGLAPLSIEPAARSPQPAAAFINSFIRPFDMAQAPLLRVGLIQLEKNNHILMVDMHHILTDFLSQEILIKEFVTLYLGVPLEELKLQYKDYSHWQNQLVLSGEMKKQEEFWLNQFKEGLPAADIPLDFPRPPHRTFAGDKLAIELDHRETRELISLARAENVTLFMLFLAMTNVLLHILSGQEKITIGTVAAGRRHPDLDKIIGAFVNTLVLVNTPSPAQTFRQLLRQVKKQTLQAFDNQDFQFEELVQKAKVKRDPTRNPLFDVMFSFTPGNPAAGTPEEDQTNIYENTPNIRVGPYNQQGVNVATFDLMLTGTNQDEHSRFIFSYSSEIFKKETMQRYANYFQEIVSAVAADADILLKHINVATGLETVVTNAYDENSQFHF